MAAGIRRVSRSANEVQTLVTKAARGAGAPAAQAASFGAAAVRHLTAGRSVSDLSEALDALPQGPILDMPLALARVVERVQDSTAEGELTLPQAPDLILSYAEALPFACVCTPTKTGTTVTIDTTRPAVRKPVVRLTLPFDFARMLNDLLAKTLVPETAASRLGGAGAGLTDND